jgi:hypothetical protein
MTRSIQIGITELLQQIENPKVIYDTFLNVLKFMKTFTISKTLHTLAYSILVILI